jgi:hypothetical protein
LCNKLCDNLQFCVWNLKCQFLNKKSVFNSNRVWKKFFWWASRKNCEKRKFSGSREQAIFCSHSHKCKMRKIVYIFLSHEQKKILCPHKVNTCHATWSSSDFFMSVIKRNFFILISAKKSEWNWKFIDWIDDVKIFHLFLEKCSIVNFHRVKRTRDKSLYFLKL